MDRINPSTIFRTYGAGKIDPSTIFRSYGAGWMFVLLHQIPEESDEKQFAFGEKEINPENLACPVKSRRAIYLG